ncbi:MAG: LPS-assembly protein LptD [Spongiibacteraceae bacterium]
MTYLSRPTFYLSASLLLLPATAYAADGWSCLPSADGGWSCSAKSEQPVSANTAAPKVTEPSTTAAQPASTQPSAATSQSPAPATTATPTHSTQAKTLPESGWDWIATTAALPNAQCSQPSPACDGFYVEAPLDWEDSDKSPKDVPARISAAHAEWEGDIVKMDGGVILTRGNTQLIAERADFNRSTNHVNLYGKVIVRQPHLKISGNSADVTTDNNFGHVIDARMLDYKAGIRVTAEKLTRRKESVIELDRATYTICPPEKEDWRLDSKRIRLNRETGRGEAGHTVIRVADVPVFYTPYLNFPIDDRRQSGFLWPIMGKSSSGFDLSIPYYLNLAPNYDATLSPRLITDHGTMLEAEGRYLNRFSNWVLSGNQLKNDEASGDDRWLVGLQENGNLNSYFSTNIDYTRVSDNDYFSDFSINSINIKRQTALNQQASLNLGYLNWFSSLQVQRYQIIDELVAEPYRKAPQFTLGRSADGDNFKLDYSLFSEITRFDHTNPNSTTDLGSPWITGTRTYVEPGISFPMRWTSSFINPEFRMRYVGYNLNRPDSQPGETQPSALVPETILDAGVFFERETELFGSSYLQTLEPRLYYLYSPYQDQSDQPLFDTNRLTFDYQQLFQPRRLIGQDRLEDFNQLAFGMTSRMIDDESGAELGRASVGQIFYFADRRIDATINDSVADQANSAIAGQVVLQPSNSLWAASNILWDQSNNNIEQGNVSVHHVAKSGAIFNVAYRYHQIDPTVSTLSNGLRQADVSAALPLSRRWRLLARLNYDLDLHTPLEDLVGFEYEDCCWFVRFAYQRAALADTLDVLGEPILERDETFMIEFQLKGLGGLGQKMNSLLQESIWGYRDRY